MIKKNLLSWFLSGSQWIMIFKCRMNLIIIGHSTLVLLVVFSAEPSITICHLQRWFLAVAFQVLFLFFFSSLPSFSSSSSLALTILWSWFNLIKLLKLKSSNPKLKRLNDTGSGPTNSRPSMQPPRWHHALDLHFILFIFKRNIWPRPMSHCYQRLVCSTLWASSVRDWRIGQIEKIHHHCKSWFQELVAHNGHWRDMPLNRKSRSCGGHVGYTLRLFDNTNDSHKMENKSDRKSSPLMPFDNINGTMCMRDLCQTWVSLWKFTISDLEAIMGGQN